ncbi:peptidoglycan DD-metalloendopeptidase family protein [Patescibacteria group bacterium]|nr:peptidoglycan DD-metalloendopeptidase family protein [Patescibacteria group bacterium]
MRENIKRLSVKLALLLLKGAAKTKGPLAFVFGRLQKSLLSPFGKTLYWFFFQLYKIYFYFKRQFEKRIPAKDILSLATNKYIVHAVIIVIAIATVSQNIYAHSGALGDYGKKSILFRLTRPIDEDEVVEGVPIHSDIESEALGEQGIFEGGVAGQVETDKTLGFVGTDYAPTLETKSTRTSVEYYIVGKGDTLGRIAEDFGISLNTLLWANQLTARSYIRPGDKLTILPVSGVSHTTKKGDTLAGIASKYKADKDKILEFNHLADASSLQVGQVLVIPDGQIVYVAPKVTYDQGYAGKSYASSGELLWPVASKRITQYFNWRHPAIDIGLPTGSRILASDDGRIIYAGWGTGYGYEVLIDHGNGYKTRYAHASRLYVRTGATVSRGQTVALSGNTGWSTGPHLHYEVYINGVRRNPLLYIR